MKWRLNNFGDATISEGTFDASKGANTFSVSGTMNEPGFMRLDVTDQDAQGKSGKTQFFGVAYDPYDIKPGAECPADFNDFWAAAVRKYDETVTAPIKVTKIDDDPSEERDLYELEIPTIDGRSVWGYLSEPKDLSKGPFPVLVTVPGAGPSTWGAEGDDKTIRMVVNVHYYRPLRGEAKRSERNEANQKAEDEAWAKRYPVKHVRYTTTGIASSREEYYYYGVLLGINRAVDWLAARPEVDRRRFRYWGGSQGGGFGLWLCGLNRNFTRAVVGIPALTDLLGFRQGGRESGWPRLVEGQLDENKAAAERNAPYFCGVNFARNISIPIRVEVGSADTVCPPMAGFSAFNVMPSKDKDILIGLGQGHSLLPEIREKLDRWLKQGALDIQRQIDDMHAAGGGRVTIPAGRYETGPIHLRSNVELHFEDGAELLFTDDINAYLPPVETSKGGIECLSYSPLIYANGATNIAITGRGRIAPRMGLWECWRWTGEKTKAARNVLANVWGANDVPLRDRDITKLDESKSRPQFIGLRRCRNVRLEDFKMRHSPSWCVHLLECDGVEVRNIDIEAFLNNNDGIDIESSRNVLVEDCRFSVGDDIICLKSGKDRDGRRRGIPTENVVVRRCVADCGHAFFGIGSELSGGIRNAVMEDCVMEGTCAWLFRIKTTPTRAGFVENVAMRRVKAKTITASVLNITYGYNGGAGAKDVSVVPPTAISGVVLKDVKVERAERAIEIEGDGRRPVKGVSLNRFAVERCLKPDVVKNADVLRSPDIQHLIDEAAANGGGVVVVPAGRHLVGQIDLRSNVELHLEKGAVLEGKVGLENYRVTTLPYSEGTWSAVVSAIGVTNVAITGEGEIFGNGTAWPQPEDYGGNQEGLRPRGVFFADCRDVRLSDFTLRDSACWGVVFKCCENVDVRRLRIDNHANANNDGIDLEARNAVIADCDIDAGDDGVCIKSNNPDFVVENVLVTNVTARSHCNALKLGTASHGTMRDILFVDCRTEAPRRDFADRRFGRNRPWYVNECRAKAYPGVGADEPSGMSAIVVENVDGGTVENVAFRRIVANGTCVPLFVRGGTRSGRSCGTPPSDRYVFRGMIFEDVEGEALSSVASSITGVAGCRAKGVALRNVRIVCRGGGDTAAERTRPVPEVAGKYPDAHMFGCILPAYGLYVRHVDGLQLDNVSFPLAPGTSDRREPMVFDDVCSEITGSSAMDGATTLPSACGYRLKRCRRACELGICKTGSLLK